jgi:photosystem II stability/assembly factor-like uncharacterized protein
MARAAAHLLALLFLGLLAIPALAHDPSAWGGVYRSRDDGGSWLAIDADLFIGASLAIAVSPTDPNHLLYATDTRLMRSRNGGRDWSHEAAEHVHGAVFATAFGMDGRTALASTTSGLFRGRDTEPWRPVDAPSGTTPARFITPLATAGGFVFAGPAGLYRSTDDGITWKRTGEALPEDRITALVRVDTALIPQLFVVVGGHAWTSPDTGLSWRPMGLPAGRTETVSADRAGNALWAFADDRVQRSTDGGATWQPVGSPVAPAGITVRGLAVANDGATLTLATHRGVLRSTDAGATWNQVEGALPTKLEAGFLVRDAHDARTLYAGFALTPYGEIWRGFEDKSGISGSVRLPAIAAGTLLLATLVALGVRTLRRRRASSSPTEPPPP